MKDRNGKIANITESQSLVESSGDGKLVENIVADTSTTLNYANPPVLDGYDYVEGRWNNGFMIKRISDGSELVWVPVGCLDSNGTLDGVHFVEKFGRRNYQNDKFSDEISKDFFSEPMEDEFIKQIESVKKYGGFYISSNNISKAITGEPQSRKGRQPLGDINFNTAKEYAKIFEDREDFQSHLTYGAEYDSVLEWFIKSGARTFEEIASDSSSWGNYSDFPNPSNNLENTGSCEMWITNNISDFAGNIDEWTQERYNRYNVMRGGYYKKLGKRFPVSYRCYCDAKCKFNTTGFRIALWIK